MNVSKQSLKIYQVPIQTKAQIVLEYYEFGMPIIESLADAKFNIMNKFARNMVNMCDKEHNVDSDFFFQLCLEPKEVDELRKFLSKHKKFIFKYIISQDEFVNSHIYQLYLQYIPHKLTEVEKSIFLDAYINMIANLRGNVISNEKRKKLEEHLRINRF